MRRRMSKSASSKYFRAGMGAHPQNFAWKHMRRGGIRLS